MNETNKNQFISAETKKVLEEETLSNIQTFTNLVDGLRNSIRMLDNADELLEKPANHNKHEQASEIYHLKRLSEYSLLLGLIWLDITTAYRIYINAKENYEVIYSIKQLIVTINESYKKIYHYIIDKNENQKLSKRNESFWVRDIGELLNKELPYLLSEYKKITEDLELYIDENLERMKVQRDLAVHYDNSPSKVYDMLASINIESVTIKTIPFMNILLRMFLFSKNILIEYSAVISKRKDDTFSFHYEKIEKLKLQFANNLQVTEMLNDLQKKLTKFQSK